MFFPEARVRVFAYDRPRVDIKKSFTGLYALTRQRLGRNPLTGELPQSVVLGPYGAVHLGKASGAGAACLGLVAPGPGSGDGLHGIEASAGRHCAGRMKRLYKTKSSDNTVD